MIALETILEKNFATDSTEKRLERKVAEFKNHKLDTNLKRKSSSEYTEKKQLLKLLILLQRLHPKKILT